MKLCSKVVDFIDFSAGLDYVILVSDCSLQRFYMKCSYADG